VPPRFLFGEGSAAIKFSYFAGFAEEVIKVLYIQD
jgi:hypothetical protein